MSRDPTSRAAAHPRASDGPCANGCGRERHRGSPFCLGCLVAPPQVHPFLLDAAYLEACVLELARRGGQPGNDEIVRAQVERAWRLSRAEASAGARQGEPLRRPPPTRPGGAP